MTTTVRAAGPVDAAMLAELGARTFRETYADSNAEHQLEAYVAEAYAEEVQRVELADPTVTYLVAEVDGTPVGFALVRTGEEAPPQVGARRPVHLDRIYVDRRHQGGGAGAALVRAVLELAGEGGHDLVWLAVWERNLAAIAYYRRWGFEQVGTIGFWLGTERQTDLLMRRSV